MQHNHTSRPRPIPEHTSHLWYSWTQALKAAEQGASRTFDTSNTISTSQYREGTVWTRMVLKLQLTQVVQAVSRYGPLLGQLQTGKNCGMLQ